MVLGKYFKTPIERKRYTIDYSDWLDSGELVASVTFGVTPADASPVVIDGNANNPTATGVVFYASGGLDGASYKVTARLLSSNGQTREDTVQYTVKAS
jgi:hypothetical protein